MISASAGYRMPGCALTAFIDVYEPRFRAAVALTLYGTCRRGLPFAHAYARPWLGPPLSPTHALDVEDWCARGYALFAEVIS